MKTLDIEFYDIQKTQGGYVAEYSLNGEDKTPFIKDIELIDFIEENELNVIESLDNDGDYSEYTLNASTYLADNYYSVVKQFITQGL